VVPHSFGPGLPKIAPWVEEHFDFTGYALGPGAGAPEDRAALRAELGYAPGERVCVVTVGGSGVGGGLLERVIAAFPEVRRRVPELRMIVVCGPRIDRDAFPSHEGLELHGYVHGLSRHLAACDIAVVQGGLATGMELAAAGRPFLYFPLARHFEQNIHVRHRLERYGAGRAMDYATATPETIAAAIAGALAQPGMPAAVERDGAERAAKLIAELL
jgi:UDP:flavonoid glycosyltransferase YjiC (YdhE family)